MNDTIDWELDCNWKEINLDELFDRYRDVIMWNAQVTPPGDHHVQTNAPGKIDLFICLLPPAYVYCRPQTKFAKVMFLYVSVILSTGGGLPQCMMGYHPQPPGLPQCMMGYHPLLEQTPPPPQDQATHPGPGTPPVQCMVGDKVNKRAECILLECNLVWVLSSMHCGRVFSISREQG